jgi:uncharacterized protein YggE
MRRTVLAALGMVLVLVVASVGVVGLGIGETTPPVEPSASGDRTVSVSATGSASASPDQAVVAVAVSAAGEDPSSVRSALAADADALRGALEDLDVEYETASYSIDEQHREDRETRDSDDESTYRGEHRFTITVTDTADVGSVIGAAADADATVDRVRLTLSDEKREELRADAIADAMADADSQAETIAAASNLELTGVATVDAAMDRYSPVAYETAAADGGTGGETVIDGGDVSVTYSVDVTYNASG